jgi:hypothetical protein
MLTFQHLQSQMETGISHQPLGHDLVVAEPKQLWLWFAFNMTGFAAMMFQVVAAWSAGIMMPL